MRFVLSKRRLLTRDKKGCRHVRRPAEISDWCRHDRVDPFFRSPPCYSLGNLPKKDQKAMQSGPFLVDHFCVLFSRATRATAVSRPERAPIRSALALSTTTPDRRLSLASTRPRLPHNRKRRSPPLRDRTKCSQGPCTSAKSLKMCFN